MNKVLVGLLILLNISGVAQLNAQDTTSNDVTQLNPIHLHKIIAPTSTNEIIQAIKNYDGVISIGGGRYSMGGQTATENALQIDMRRFDSILNFSATNKEITVQTGITWRKIQEYIDTFNLSVKIMQSYANFTVGGSLSVNVHGRYVGEGQIILYVKQIKMVLANGDLITASTIENKEIFYAAIGGYGALGVITEATLMLTDNEKVERSDKLMSMKNYKKFFFDNIRNDSSIVFHNAIIYPNQYKKVRGVSFSKTTKELTVECRLVPQEKNYKFNQFMIGLISKSSLGKWLRQHLIDPIVYSANPVEWRNYEASYNLLELEPKSRKKSTYVLQEYFIPVDSFDTFYPRMVEILRLNKVNVINISIRHSKQDTGSIMAWAKTEVFAFVIYYKQGVKEEEKAIIKQWTQQLIDAAISFKGSYYLPYQIHATQEQFQKAYPNASEFFALKNQLDPNNKFSNKLWDTYYKAKLN